MSEASKKILSFYDRHIDEHGFGPQAVGWNDKQSQETRFTALCKIGDINNNAVLDVGCGLGDFYRYLSNHYKGVWYTGIDINPRYIESAQSLYPDANFEVVDFEEYVGKQFDYIFASGAFAVKIPNYKEIYFNYIEKMFKLARKGIAFTMLDEAYHPNDEEYSAYSVEEVYNYCLSLTSDVAIDHSYLEHDFTVMLKPVHK